MTPPKQSSADFFKALTVIYVALLIVQLAFSIIAYYMVNTGLANSSLTELREELMVIIALALLAGQVSHIVIFRKKMTQIQSITLLSDKLIQYRSAFIIRCALLEGPSFFGIICFMMTAERWFLIAPLLSILTMLSLKPSADRAIIDMALEGQEAATLRNPDAEI